MFEFKSFNDEFGVLRQRRSFRAATTFGVERHHRMARWCANWFVYQDAAWCCPAGNWVSLECCGNAAAFVQRLRLALDGHHRMARWCVNWLFSNTLRDVALRAIGLTGASARRLSLLFGVLRQRRSFRAATTFGVRRPSPDRAVVRELVRFAIRGVMLPCGQLG